MNSREQLMSNKKRWKVVALVAATAVVSVLSACSSTTKSSSGGNTLDVVYWDYGPVAESQNKDVAAAFEKANPGTKVNLTSIAGQNWGTYYANVATLIASGKHPDIVYLSSEGVKFLAQNNLVLPINNYLKTDKSAGAIQSDIAPSLIKTFTVGGDVLGLSNSWNSMVIYYNTDLFKAAGVPAPSPDWTWADFEATAQKLTKHNQYGFAWTGNEIFPGILPWVANANGNLVSPDVCKATADSPEVTKAVSFLEDLIQKKIAPAPMPMGDILTRFKSGQLAMFGAGRWATAAFTPAGFKSFDIQRFPKGDTYQTIVGASSYPILKSSKNPDLAWKFQKFTVSSGVQDSQIGTPAKPGDSNSSLRSTAQKAVTEGLPPTNSKLYYDSIDKYTVLAPFPGPANYSQFEATVLRHTQLIFGGQESVQTGLANMQKDLAAIVSCN
jgi:multiple sugar transport system substrate-binding protein